MEAARDLRVREQSLHGVHPDRLSDRGRASGCGPGRRLQPGEGGGGRQRRRRGLPRRVEIHGPRAQGRRAGPDRGDDLPPQRALARGSRQVPPRGRAGEMARARSPEDLPRAAAQGGLRRGDAQGPGSRSHAQSGRSDRDRQVFPDAPAGGNREGSLGGRRRRVAELTYRDAVAAGIAQEMERDPNVVFLGEDVAAAGGVFKTTVGLLEKFGPKRVRDCPISEQAIIGAAMGAAMTGLRPIAEIMFSDFLAVCWDLVANEIAKTRYMTNGQIALPLVIRTANGGGSRFGAQHSQSVENWAMAVPGLKVVAPAFPADVKGLLAAAVRDPDPVLFFEQKSLYSMKGEVPDGEHVDRLGKAKVLRQGKDCTVVALAAMVHRAMGAAQILEKEHGISCTVVDVRSLVPLDTQTILSEVVKTGRLVTVEENPRLCGWGAEVASIVADECFWDLDGPVIRITTPHIPLPSADQLEDNTIPSVERVVREIREKID